MKPTSFGSRAEWDTGGHDSIGIMVDTAGECSVWVAQLQGEKETRLYFELTHRIAAELATHLATWLATEADSFEDLWKESEDRHEASAKQKRVTP